MKDVIKTKHYIYTKELDNEQLKKRLNDRIDELVKLIKTETQTWRKNVLRDNLKASYEMFAAITGTKHEKDKNVPSPKTRRDEQIPEKKTLRRSKLGRVSNEIY